MGTRVPPPSGTKSTAPKNPCVICLDEISEPSTALPCRHPYDYLCLINWLELRQTCPLCNTAVSHVQVFDRGNGKNVMHRVDPLRQPPPTALSNSRPPQIRRRRPAATRPPPVATDTAILQRRHVYRNHLLSLHVGSNRISRFRSYTPRMVRDDEELQSRAKMFIRRELQAFEWTASNREFIIEYILAILKTMDLKSATGAAEDMLADLLGRENAQTFCHEIHAFLRSPYKSLSDFDRSVQYKEPLPTRFDQDGMPVGHTQPRKRRIEEVEGDRLERNRRRRDEPSH